MSEWVAVVSEEGDEPIEIPTESNGTMLLSTLAAQFPRVTGLKFRNPESNLLRGVRCHDNILFPPYDAEGWGGHTFICTVPTTAMKMSKVEAKVKEEAALKRKSENDPGGLSSKNLRVDEEDEDSDSDDQMDEQEEVPSSDTCDLIVLGLPWVATEKDIRDYFDPFGELSMVQLKRGHQGQSKGFAFIRFKELEVQNKVLLTRHMIKDRWCDVKVPESQELKHNKAAASCKIFVTNVSEMITVNDLKEHFETFGTVTDIYIPKPHRAFAFISFSESRVAQSLFGKDHVIQGVSVHIGKAKPKAPKSGGGGGGRGDDRYGRDHYSGGYSGGNQGYHSPWINGPNSGSPDYSYNYRRSGPPRGYY